MPHGRAKKGGREQKERKNVMNMMGYGDDDSDDDDDGMDAELAAILGDEKPKTKKKAPTKLLDWSIIDAQVTSSMRDVDEDADNEVTEADEEDFLSELNDLVGEDEPELLKPEGSKGGRSPSPQPPSSGSTLDMLRDRKVMYEKAVANAQSSNQSSKVRRLQRGVKTLDGLIRSARAGKPINEDDIPPVVATGLPPPSNQSRSSPPILAQPLASLDTSSALFSNENTPQKNLAQQVVQPVTVPTPLVKIDSTPPAKVTAPTVDANTIKTLEDRKHKYRDAALNAKRNGNKEEALKYLKVLKQFDVFIAAANEGKEVDISKVPPAPQASVKANDYPSSAQAVTSPIQSATNVAAESSQAPSAPAQPTVPTKPKTVLEALEQRMTKYQSSSDEAAKEGNGGKARRMGRIVKQYKDAIRTHKAGRSVNFDELPVPPGFPPIPGIKETPQDENLMQKAKILLQDDVEDSPGPSKQSDSHQRLAAPATGRQTLPQGNENSTRKRTPSPNPKKSSSGSGSALYEKQVIFLQNRQAAFKKAALSAKQRGDRTAALDLLRKMKGFDSLIEGAKSGLKVNLSQVPQPPLESSSGGDDGFEVIEHHEISSSHPGSDDHSKKNTPEEDDALYSRLLDTLHQQVKKARAYAEQATHTGEISVAERSDRLASTSQVDYDYVRSCRRHGDPPPRFYYENQVFNVARLNPDIGSDEMELTIKQCIDLRGVKDNKIFVEWEMPFPHDNPIKGKTEEGKGSIQSPQFPEAIFRVPYNRKHKSNQRAIKSKSIKLDLVQKGGFLRSDKTVGAALIKLNPLETRSDLHAVEELKDGRTLVGKIEAFVKLRTPLVETDSQTIKERWLSVEHIKRSRNAAPAPSSKSSSSSSSSKSASASSSSKSASASSSSKSSSAPSPSSRSAPRINIASIPVLELELKVVNARIDDCRKKGSSSKDFQKESAAIQQKIITTKKYLRDGGSQAQAEYVSCLKRHFDHLNNESQVYVKQGRRDQAKLALTKKSLVKAEMEKYSSRRT